MPQVVEKWETFEVSLQGPDQGNPFIDVSVSATFARKHRRITVEGFYDGGGTYRVRFMPDVEGKWTYVTASNHPELDARSGEFECIAPSASNHGPVRVVGRYHFAYADGTGFANIGTTCYAWAHQPASRIEQTLSTLEASPFDKLRMCVLPKSYRYNENEPPHYPFPVLEHGPSRWCGYDESQQAPRWRFDCDRFVPAFFAHVETCVGRLRDLGIEADVILMHPYDRWGFCKLPPEVEDRYLRYVVARLAAYRNVWWSLANEWDFVRHKPAEDWERHARVIREHDPYDHLRSIHNGARLYDHGRPWVTHVSYQGHPQHVGKLREEYGKPVVVDECCYEGDVPHGWGNISARELTTRFWLATCLGGYCGHGETYLHPEDILWWSKGGVLHGQCPERIAFLRRVVGQGDGRGFEPIDVRAFQAVARGKEEILIFTYDHQPAILEATLPEGLEYNVEVIDPWEMTVDALPGRYAGETAIPLPVRPGLVVRAVGVR
jgi:hypothetical protein